MLQNNLLLVILAGKSISVQENCSFQVVLIQIFTGLIMLVLNYNINIFLIQ